MTTYAMVGTLRALPGRGADLLAAMNPDEPMPGCLQYAVHTDAADGDAIWVYEVWESRAAHDASLQLPAVRAAIGRAMPLLAGPPEGHELVPVSGVPAAAVPTGAGPAGAGQVTA